MDYVGNLMFFVYLYICLKFECKTEEELQGHVAKDYNGIFDLFDSVVNQNSPEFFAVIYGDLEMRFFKVDANHHVLKLKMPEQLVANYLAYLGKYQQFRKHAQIWATQDKVRFPENFLDFSVNSMPDHLEITIKKR